MFDFLLPDCWVSSKRSPGMLESWSLNYKTVMGLSLTSAVLILCIVMFYWRRLAKKIEKQQKEVKLEEEMNWYRELGASKDFIRSLVVKEDESGQNTIEAKSEEINFENCLQKTVLIGKDQFIRTNEKEFESRVAKHVETFIGEVFGDGMLPETIKLSDALELVDIFGLYLQRIHETTLRENNLLKIQNSEKNVIMQVLRAENQLLLEKSYMMCQGIIDRTNSQRFNEDEFQPLSETLNENKVELPSEVPNVNIMKTNDEKSKTLQLEIQKPCLNNPKKVVPQNLKSKVEPPFKAPIVNKKKAYDEHFNKLPLEIEKPSSGNKKQVSPQKLKSSVAPPSKPRELKIDKPSCLSTKVLPQKLKSSVAPPSKPRDLNIEKPSCIGKNVLPQKLKSSVAPPSKPRDLNIEKPSCIGKNVLPQKLKSSVAPPTKPRNVNKIKTEDKNSLK